MNTHSFLVDDDDDYTDRSIAPTVTSPSSTLPHQTQNRSHPLLQQNSYGNQSLQSSRKPTRFTCCGFTVDLSPKNVGYSSNGDTSSRHSTIGKSTANTVNDNDYHHMARKSRTCSQSPISLSPFDRHLRQQKTISYKSNADQHRPTTRRRATTVVHCSRHLPSSTITSIADKSMTLTNESAVADRSVSRENERAPLQPAHSHQSDTSSISSPSDMVFNASITSAKTKTMSTASLQNTLDERSLSAYVVETC